MNPMKPTPRTLTLLAVSAVAFAGLAMFAFRAPAASAMERLFAPPSPPVVGLVDLERLINNLTELKAQNDKIEAKTTDRNKELRDLENELKAKQKTIDEVPKENVNERIRLVADYIERSAYAKTRRDVLQQINNLERGEIVRSLYIKMLTTLEQFAANNNYDLVMMDDRTIELPLGGTNEDYNTIVRNKRVLFASRKMDITDEIITIMNNAYAAGASPTPSSKSKK